MYSMVLMMAMTTSPEAAAAGNGCYGCTGSSCQGVVVVGCTGCTGSSCTGSSCTGSSCTGSACCGGEGSKFLGLREKLAPKAGFLGLGLFKGSSCTGASCTGSSCTGYSCTGSACMGSSCMGASCHGISASCHGCMGVSCHGCVGASCHGTIVTPVVPVEEKKIEEPKKMPEEKKMEGKKAAFAAPATIEVKVPADARVFVDGVATKSTSEVRVFATPALEANNVYFYTISAEVEVNGQTMTSSQKVAVRAGEMTSVSLEPSVVATVASK